MYAGTHIGVSTSEVAYDTHRCASICATPCRRVTINDRWRRLCYYLYYNNIMWYDMISK